MQLSRLARPALLLRHSLANASQPAVTAVRTLASRPHVNDLYQPGYAPDAPASTSSCCARSPCVCSRADARTEALASVSGQWSCDKVLAQTAKHSLFTWGASGAMSDAAIPISHGEGVYFYDMNGKRYLDFNSQAMCTHFGHSTPQSVIDAVVEQMQRISYTYPGISTTPVRAKLCTLLASIVPGDINAFLFPSSGAEANEVALRIARVYTGRHKVISRYRSYHGGTLGTISLTGDQRRWPAENGANGVVHTFDPYPYSFSWGANEAEITQNSIRFLREQIAYEGPKNIAAIFMESITGTNGVLKPPVGYLEAVRDICNEHGIIMVCDEVMAGFGRSGKLFGFCHAPSVVPDIVTFAKGVNGATIPLGGVGVRDFLADHFRKNALSIGSTYNGHPVALASALASIQELLSRDLVNHAARMEEHMKTGLQRLIDRHPSVKQARVTGLFGCFDIAKNMRGDFVAKVTDPLTPAMASFKARVLEKGLFTMMRGHTVFCNPPLVIQPAEIKEAFDIFDDALTILDNAMEK